MTGADIVIVVFAICNSLRLFAYLPQLVSVVRDGNGASGVSLTTWALFTVANGSTTAYAFVIVGDGRMGVIFASNTLFSFAIAFGTLVKRRLKRREWAAASRSGLRTRHAVEDQVQPR